MSFHDFEVDLGPPHRSPERSPRGSQLAGDDSAPCARDSMFGILSDIIAIALIRTRYGLLEHGCHIYTGLYRAPYTGGPLYRIHMPHPPTPPSKSMHAARQCECFDDADLKLVPEVWTSYTHGGTAVIASGRNVTVRSAGKPLTTALSLSRSLATLPALASVHITVAWSENIPMYYQVHVYRY